MRSSPSNPDPLDPGPRGFAHRGLHGPDVPENSLGGFAAAIALGAGIECDVRLSGDGAAVVFHDSDLKRMCGLAMEIETARTALLSSQRLSGSGQYIPPLRQALEQVNGRVSVLLELKTRDRNAPLLCRAVRDDIAVARGPIGVMSFDPQVGRWFRQHARHVRRGLVIGRDTSPLKRWASIVIAQPQFLAVHRELLRERWVARARRRMPVYTWTIRTATERAQAEVQADSLIWEGDGRPRN